MAVIRVNKTTDYTVMSNTHIREKEMTLKAKGLLSLMLSLPDNWGYSITGLETLSKDGKDSIMSALAELEQFGYLKRTQTTDEKGRFTGYDYDIYEKPFTEKPQQENPYAENPNTENPPLLNTNKLNNKKLNTNKSNTNTPGSEKRFKAPTVDEVRAYCQERKNKIDPEHFVDYYKTRGWKVGKAKTPMQDWKAAVRTWEKKKFDNQQAEPEGQAETANPGFDEWMNNFMGKKEGQ